MRLLHSKLALAPSSRFGVDGTHGGEIRRIRNENGKMAKDPYDSQKKDGLITGCRILIDIKDRSDKMRGDVNRKIL